VLWPRQSKNRKIKIRRFAFFHSPTIGIKRRGGDARELGALLAAHTDIGAILTGAVSGATARNIARLRPEVDILGRLPMMSRRLMS